MLSFLWSAQPLSIDSWTVLISWYRYTRFLHIVENGHSTSNLPDSSNFVQTVSKLVLLPFLLG